MSPKVNERTGFQNFEDDYFLSKLLLSYFSVSKFKRSSRQKQFDGCLKQIQKLVALNNQQGNKGRLHIGAGFFFKDVANIYENVPKERCKTMDKLCCLKGYQNKVQRLRQTSLFRSIKDRLVIFSQIIAGNTLIFLNYLQQKKTSPMASSPLASSMRHEKNEQKHEKAFSEQELKKQNKIK